MRLNFILFAGGAWLLQQQMELPALQYGWAILAVVPLLFIAARSPLRWWARVILAALWLAAGFCWAAFVAHGRLAEELPVQWEGRDISVIGVVAGLPQTFDRSVRFDLDVEQTLTTGARVPGKLALAWWGAGARDGTDATLPDINAGERWRFTVRLKRPHGMMNPHGFDY
jgi:competence protein ComEC